MEALLVSLVVAHTSFKACCMSLWLPAIVAGKFFHACWEASVGFLSFASYLAAADPSLSAIADYKAWHMPNFKSILFPEEPDIICFVPNTSCIGPCGPPVSVSVRSNMIRMVAVQIFRIVLQLEHLPSAFLGDPDEAASDRWHQQKLAALCLFVRGQLSHAWYLCRSSEAACSLGPSESASLEMQVKPD